MTLRYSIVAGVSRWAHSATSLLKEEEQWARRALPRANRAWWNASLSGNAADYRRMEAADRAINRHYSRATVVQRIDRLLRSRELDGLTQRRLGRLGLAYRAKQAPIETLDQITRTEAAVQELYSTFRAEFEGHAAPDNELEDILRASSDAGRVQAAWEARKQIGAAVAVQL